MSAVEDGAGGRAGLTLAGWRISWDVLALALFFVVFVLILATFTDYGVTWDEDVQNWYGESVLNYYLTGFKDLSSLHYLDLFNYGAGFDMTAAALNRISPFGTYETRHLLNALVGLLGHRRHLEAGQGAGRAARGIFRRALPRPHAQLLRPDVQQPQGHPRSPPAWRGRSITSSGCCLDCRGPI